MRREKNVRCCIVCRRPGPKESFWRIVRQHHSNTVQLDQGMGRSAYLCPTEACLKAAQKKRRIGRALRCKVSDDIYETLAARLQAESAVSVAES